ncbi:MAG: hypothetical protein DMD89_17285 [Candidatus Rokuibacteriota bacterium]|nr:MAG: hypothetical protein DMD89_17285 [Candidatus Rokubacteria bacterium]
MKKCVLVWAVALVLTLLVSARAFAQSAGSFAGDFVGVDIIKTIVCSAGDLDLTCSSGGSAFLGATIKAPAAKSKVFLIGASLQTGILTGSQIAGGTGKQSSTTTGSIVVTPEVTYGPHGKKVRVWPPAVTFDERSQTLTANLLGCLTNLDSTTGLPVVSCTEPETIGLILSTLSAHSFNFLAENVGSGVYTVKLNIGATATATSSSIAAKSQVGVGVGIVGIENCVRAS